MASGATTTSVLALLQKNYQPGVQRQFNDDFPNLRFIRQNSSSITAEGDEAVISIETGLNEGGGFHGESADVAESGEGSYDTVAVRLKQMTFRLRISLKLMRKARTAAHAFARGMQIASLALGCVAADVALVPGAEADVGRESPVARALLLKDFLGGGRG